MDDLEHLPTRQLDVVVRAYGTLRGGLGEHIEEALEVALRRAAAEAEGVCFDGSETEGEDARLSDRLFRARRAGLEGIRIRLVALRALCAPVGGLDAADAQAIAFYTRAAAERPVTLLLEDGDWDLLAYVGAKSLREAVSAPEPPEAPAPVPVLEPAAVSVEPVEPPARAESEMQPHVVAIEDARGPQTLAAFERLFVEHYLPLARGLDAETMHGARAHAAREDFRRTFARAYTEGLPAFALTGKRPRMVLDAFDVAAKAARASRAKSAQVLLVGSLRHDLAASVAARTGEMLAGRASAVGQWTLFAALPTSLERQLSTLARGVDGLRVGDTSDPEATRHPRTASVVRRVRVGSRDVYKLDLVAMMLDDAKDGGVQALDDLVGPTATVIARHIAAQPPQTLVLVAGAHGFRFERGWARSGGASPEEVIVAAHAWLSP